jgi:alpha-galactosidase
MVKNRRPYWCLIALLVAGSAASSQPADTRVSGSPQLTPAEYTWDGTRIEIRFGGHTVLRARLENPGALEDFISLVSNEDGKVDQVFKWSTRKEPLRLTGEVLGSTESFPCESERREDSPLIVRHSYGLSRSLLNRAIYDRKSDWLLSADFPTSISVEPLLADADSNTFHITMTGHDIIIRFRPGYYMKFKGLKHFQPWSYRVWDKPIAGWVSWFAFFRDITEENVKETADVLSETLLPYGLEYLQIDDGYQQTPVGVPETWLVPNKKFPSGLQDLSRYIKKKGLKPGIWTNVSFYQKEFVQKNPALFVRDRNMNPAFGSWIGYVMDGSNPKTVDELIKPVYKALHAMGWEYFKVDALRHLRYEGYNSFSDYFARKGLDREEVYRSVVQSIRTEVGPDNVLMGCWGIRPELVGLIDACRIGDDGFGYGGLAQYNSFNNVAWRNDPDHIQLTREEAYRSCMATSLTGSLFMLTDKPEVYRTPLVEPPRRCLPILFTRPGQVYDVEPSRSSQLASVETELSGAGPRPVDADQKAYCSLYLLELNLPFESWVVLGRLEGGRDSIRFSDLGLTPDKEYLVFEFWTKRFLGAFTGMLPLDAVDSTYRCQAYCIREKRSHPQIIATSRHISGGAADLLRVQWAKNSLSGESKLVPGDAYTLFLTEPGGYALRHFSCTKAEVIGNKKEGAVRIIQLKSGRGGAVLWDVQYGRADGQ